MEEKELPVLSSGKENTEKPKISFIDLVQTTMNSGQKADPLFFTKVLDKYKEDGIDVDIDFSPEMKEKIEKSQGKEGLAEWEKLHETTKQLNTLKGENEFYTPLVAPTWHNRAQGYTKFNETKEFTGDQQGEFARGFNYPVRIKSQESIADQAPSIIDYDPLKGYVERKIEGPNDIENIVSWSGEDKRLTIATNGVVGQVNPEIKKMIAEGVLDADAPFKDENGLYRYRTLAKGEKPTSNIRSIWGPESYYHNSYFSEMVESLNDFAMDSLDAAAYVGQLPTNMALNLSQKGIRSMGLESNWSDAWDQNFNEYRNWSQSRRSTRSFDDAKGAFSDFTNFSKAMTQLISQIAVTRGMGLLGGAAGTGLKGMGLALSDDMVRGMMSNTALGYGMMYASSAASEEARKNGLSTMEGDIMAIVAAGIIPLTEKMTGGQFTNKVFGPYRSKVFANKIVTEIREQAQRLGMNPSDIVKDKKTFGAFLGNVSSRVNTWLSEPAETRLKNTVQGFVGEAFQESSEDGMNMLAQEFRDWVSGEDKYDNTWANAYHELGQSFALGGLGGAFGGAMFFDKKNWEMSYVDESKYDWITSSILKGEGDQVRATLDKMYKKGQLGSTLYSAMQGSENTPKTLEKDPTAKTQNELMYQQYKAQIDLVESIQKKYEKSFPSAGKADLGDFIMQVSGGNEFVENDQVFASVAKDSAHMMQREAIAMEIKSNHAKNMLALELAKAGGIVDLSEIESIHAFNGKLISIQRKGKSPKAPNVQTKNVIEEALREVQTNGPKISDVAKTHEDFFQSEKALGEAEYRLSKNPTNPDFIAEHQVALKAHEDAEKAFESARTKEKLSEPVLDILNALRNFKSMGEDFSKGNRKVFYQHKTALEIAKKTLADDFKVRPNMTVYEFRKKNKDRDYFVETVDSENQNNQDLLAQFDQLATEASTLSGTALRDKIDEIERLVKVNNKLFLNPAIKSLLDAKIKDITDNNGLVSAAVNATLRIKAGENMTEGRLQEVLRRINALSALMDDKGNLKQEVINQKETVESIIQGEIDDAGDNFESWDDSADWTLIFSDTQNFMDGSDLDELMRFYNDNFDTIQKAIYQLGEAGFSLPGFSANEFLDVAARLGSPEFQDFLANRKQKDRLESIRKADVPMEYLQWMQKDLQAVFPALDFSDFTSDDLKVLARAYNANTINQDNAGNSLLRKYSELVKEATDPASKEDFTRIEELQQLQKELRENLVELILENKINEWGTENKNEKFMKLYLSMKMMDQGIGKMIELAQSNLNKRAGRDYKVKQGMINFEAAAIAKLNDILGFLTPDEKDELEKLKVLPAREVTKDEDKKAVDERLEKLIDFEEKASEALKNALTDHTKASEILNKLGLTKDQLFSFNSIGLVSGSAFRDLHEDSENPYDPTATHSQKEQLFNFLVQLERGNIRTFFNRLNEVIDKDKAENTNFPSFEQILSARQLFGFLISDQDSILKGALNAELETGNSTGSSRLSDQLMFLRGIAGAGKSTFVTNLGFQLYSNEMKRRGQTASAKVSAPNQAQLDNIASSLGKIPSGAFSFETIEAEKLVTVGGKFDFALMGDSRIVVFDEATLLDYHFMDLINNIEAHNQSAAPENKIKILLIGDEFQNGPDSSVEAGKISFYRSSALPIAERTVPLTTPYRSGKIESYNLQMFHRKMIAELNKIQRAKQYADKGELYTQADGSKVRVDNSNWVALAFEAINRFNTPKTFTYHEKAPGVIGYGVKTHSKPEEIYQGFAKSLLHAIAEGTEEDLILIVQKDEDVEKAVTNVLAAVSAQGGSVSADRIRTQIKSSKEIQGLSKKHVFVAVDLETAMREAGRIEEIKSALQALYVGESREVDSVVILHPGSHMNVKVLSKDAVFSYSKVEMDKDPVDAEAKKQKQDMVVENKNLVDLVSRIARPEESLPEEKSKEVESGTGVSGKPSDPPAGNPPPAKPKPPKTRKMKPENETKENHEKNKSSDAMEDFFENFDSIYDAAVTEIKEKGLTSEDILNELKEEGDGACNI